MALLDGFVGDADGSTVVTADVGRRLLMAHLGEGDSYRHGVLAVVEHAAGFGFGCEGDDDFQNGAVGMSCIIFGWRFVGSEGLLSRGVSWWFA